MDSNQKEARIFTGIFYQWLTDQKHLLFFHLLFFLCFNSVLYLSLSLKRGMEDLLYLDLMYLLLLGGYLGYTWSVYRQRYGPLLRALEENRGNLTLYLPEARTPTTRLIQRMAHGLQREHAELEHQLMTTLRESEEYAVLWAHEIKSPLAVMSLTLQASSDEELKLDLLEELDRVQHLVEQSLVFSRSSAFSKDYMVTEVSPEKILSELLKKHARSLILKRLAVETTAVQKNSRVVSDRKWLSFVLEQILVNAVKYAYEGGKIQCAVEEDERTWKIRICDEGMGIAPEDLPRIYDRGFTGQNGRTQGQSTGMGLFLAKRIAESLGHQIYAQSELGKGSQFTVVIGKFDTERRYLTGM